MTGSGHFGSLLDDDDANESSNDSADGNRRRVWGLHSGFGDTWPGIPLMGELYQSSCARCMLGESLHLARISKELLCRCLRRAYQDDNLFLSPRAFLIVNPQHLPHDNIAQMILDAAERAMVRRTCSAPPEVRLVQHVDFVGDLDLCQDTELLLDSELVSLILPPSLRQDSVLVLEADGQMDEVSSGSEEAEIPRMAVEMWNCNANAAGVLEDEDQPFLGPHVTCD